MIEKSLLVIAFVCLWSGVICDPPRGTSNSQYNYYPGVNLPDSQSEVGYSSPVNCYNSRCANDPNCVSISYHKSKKTCLWHTYASSYNYNFNSDWDTYSKLGSNLLITGSGNILPTGAYMLWNDQLLIPSTSLDQGSNRFIFQDDGNLVLYRTNDGATWSTETCAVCSGRDPGNIVVMQGDCNLVMYDLNGKARWSTSTYGQGSNCYLKRTSTGDVIIYDGNNKLIKVVASLSWD